MFVFFLKKKIRERLSHIRKNETSEFVDYRDTRSVIVLMEQDQYPILLPLVDELSADGKAVTVVMLDLLTPAAKPVAYPDNVLRITRREIGRLNKEPREETVRKFQAVAADAILDFTVSEYPAFAYLLAFSSVKQKMGFGKKNFLPYNFIIQGEKGMTPLDLAQKILFYWRNIDIKKRIS